MRIGRRKRDALPASVAIKGDVSSQFLSALLMALPLVTRGAAREVTVEVLGELISRPYVAITTNLMRRFGVQVQVSADRFRAISHLRRCCTIAAQISAGARAGSKRGAAARCAAE